MGVRLGFRLQLVRLSFDSSTKFSSLICTHQRRFDLRLFSVRKQIEPWNARRSDFAVPVTTNRDPILTRSAGVRARENFLILDCCRRAQFDSHSRI